MHRLQSTFTKVKKENPRRAWTRIIAVQFDSLIDTLFDWLFIETIDIYESPIDNIIFNEPFCPNF